MLNHFKNFLLVALFSCTLSSIYGMDLVPKDSEHAAQRENLHQVFMQAGQSGDKEHLIAFIRNFIKPDNREPFPTLPDLKAKQIFGRFRQQATEK